jgi:hypothetical protein
MVVLLHQSPCDLQLHGVAYALHNLAPTREAWPELGCAAVGRKARLAADLRPLATAPWELTDGFVRHFPCDFFLQPDLSNRRETIGTIESACGNVDCLRIAVVFVGDRTAARAAELARDPW